MALSAKERQATYREQKKLEQGKRLDLIISAETAYQLDQLALHGNKTKKAILADLLSREYLAQFPPQPVKPPPAPHIEPQDTEPTKKAPKTPKRAKVTKNTPIEPQDSFFNEEAGDLLHDWRKHGLNEAQLSKVRYYKERFVVFNQDLFAEQIQQGMTAEQIFEQVKDTLKDPFQAIKYDDFDYLLQEKFRINIV